MSCRELVDLPDRVLARLSGELSPEEEAGLARHLGECADCRQEAAELESVWNRLGKDPEPVPARGFARRTLEALEEATLARRVVRFPRRGAWAVLAQAAVVVLAASAGWIAARSGATTRRVPSLAAPAPAVALVPVSSERTLDAASAVPDLSGRPALANVSFRPADESGKVGVSFDVTTRYTVVGRPGDDGLARLLPYLLAGAATEGTRGRALDLVSSSMASGSATSPEVVSALVTTLRTDRNPGVRRKAAEALGQLPPSPEIRQALVETLKAEPNPGIRIVAVEALARAARELRDPAAIETLRERAADGRENGYVRVQAASALAGLTM
ncbi:MAG: hypothetical protein EDX89_07455 [Acidobacteria bacterium]|nr:MAG: hypothetical protein EDX89_07455 [Acidobacteriota bacterium]